MWITETKKCCTFKWRNASDVRLCPGIWRWNVLENWQRFISPTAFPGVTGKGKQQNHGTEMDRPRLKKRGRGTVGEKHPAVWSESPFLDMRSPIYCRCALSGHVKHRFMAWSALSAVSSLALTLIYVFGKGRSSIIITWQGVFILEYMHANTERLLTHRKSVCL